MDDPLVDLGSVVPLLSMMRQVCGGEVLVVVVVLLPLEVALAVAD
jgi:hypothetical protein